jgi:two-component system response regulator AtoC
MQTIENERTVLLGEDDLEVRSYLEMALKCQGYSVEVAQDGEEVLACLQDGQVPISAILLDIVMPRKDGLEALKEIRRLDRNVPVIMISGASSPLNVVEAMKNGATDFMAKPVNHDILRKTLKSAIDARVPLMVEQPERTVPPTTKQIVFGNSPAMREIQTLLRQIGWSEAAILIQGETGAGKEVLARELHNQSPRAKKPFLKLNCAALPSELVESELFGYERGAFTGAFQKKPGMFELADGGTLLLDEIGDMDVKLQAKLLQVLQDQEFHRLGGKDPIRVDVRIIAATHRDLERAIVENTFRQDLYYRLNVINLRVPPLRERKEDILLLADHFMRKHSPAGQPLPMLTPTLKQALLAHAWSGNIRELENVMRKFLILRNPDMIARELGSKTSPMALQNRPVLQLQDAETPSETEATILDQVTKAKQQAERTAILAALNSTHWNRKHAAILLKIDYKALLYKMKKLGIEEKMLAMPKGMGTEPLSVPAKALVKTADASD